MVTLLKSKVEVGLPTGRTRPPEFGNEESIPDGLNHDFGVAPAPIFRIVSTITELALAYELRRWTAHD